ncbi:putative acyl carrier protein [Microlunatus phosphovorus NM-1]|uniref:Putative acyl carrier protein n=1 Tax=Microlunatus phosphovorus (strain ATCC 700054 / DSM 10555 / JCM 9379 / NBRC 101784 / NCIMB 13414 / VKM Ac-1990 / NM-1) TaxID=1032480 RepID=F5XHY4_MICPN|nr:acyl carrier protein [Microlunatus phosphovorus]BAK33279.1 putative acyl carrier protein [Microlunatus phosphovorus NM-1]
MTKETIRTVLLQEISAEIAIPPADIDDQASFMRLGVSSVQALKIISRLRKQLDLDINPVALFEFKTVDDISEYLAEEAAA